MPQSKPLILLSGMAADAALFRRQRDEFPELITPEWIAPRRRESLPDYAARFARQADPGVVCIVGGASFGGIVALEMSAHLQASDCVLISSVRSASELPWWYRACSPLAALGPDRLGWSAGQVARWSRPSLPPVAAGQLRRLSQPEAEFLRWATWAVLRWRPSPRVRKIPILQIHGDADRTFPIRYVRPDVVIRGGGHLLTLTHPQQVNELLRHPQCNG